jgi:hypothetical protein
LAWIYLSGRNFLHQLPQILKHLLLFLPLCSFVFSSTSSLVLIKYYCLVSLNASYVGLQLILNLCCCLVFVVGSWCVPCMLLICTSGLRKNFISLVKWKLQMAYVLVYWSASRTPRSLENSRFLNVFHWLVVSCKFHSIYFAKFVRQIWTSSLHDIFT